MFGKQKKNMEPKTLEELKKLKRPVRHKFKAVSTKRDCIRFSSKLEAAYYVRLKLRQQAGEILFFLRQVGFDLPGGVRHFLDYVLFYVDGSVEFVEVKGRDLPVGKMKRKQVEDIYPIEIKVVSRV